MAMRLGAFVRSLPSTLHLIRPLNVFAVKVNTLHSTVKPVSEVNKGTFNGNQLLGNIRYASKSSILNRIDFWDNIKQLPSAPKPALLLGLAGLAPFVGAPYLMLTSGAFCSSLAMYQTFYGATILSFLGGVRWGFTVPSGSPQAPDFSNLGYSVAPQLWAWSTLMGSHYMDCYCVGIGGVVLGLSVTGVMDMSMPGYPGWFKGLRACLTVGAVVSMLLTLLCGALLDEQKHKEEDKTAVPEP